MSTVDRILTAGTALAVGVTIAAGAAGFRRERQPSIVSVTERLPLGDAAAQQLLEPGRWTAVLLLSSTCHYCSESAPTYRRVLTRQSALPIIIAGRESVEALRIFADSQGLKADRFESVPPDLLPVKITPAVLLVDPTGVIRGVWTGVPSEAATRAMLASVDRAVQGNSQGTR